MFIENLYCDGGISVEMENKLRKIKPDFVAKRYDNQWIIFESKGRNKYDGTALTKGKEQVRSLRTVDGKVPFLKVVVMSVINNDNLTVFLKDPKNENIGFYLHFSNLNEFYLDYYSLVFNYIKESKHIVRTFRSTSFVVAINRSEGIAIGIDKEIYNLLESIYDKEFSIDISIESELIQLGYLYDIKPSEKYKKRYLKKESVELDDYFVGNDS